MKRLCFAPVLALALTQLVARGAALFYVNDGIVNVTNPPMVDAINFVNNNTFDVFTSAPYRTSSTLNFTNHGEMSGSPGFDFETFPAGNGFAKRASSFLNAPSGFRGGNINCSGGFSFLITAFQLFGNLTGNSQFIVDATNIINSGSITMDASSLIRLQGESIDLSRGALTMQNSFTLFTGIPAFFNAGILDGYWGINFPTNAFLPTSFFNMFQNNLFVTTPVTPITFRNNTAGFQSLFLAPATTTAYVNDSGIVGSNRFVQVVFIDETNSAFANSVFFTPFDIEVQWQWTNLDYVTGNLFTNFLVLTDDFGERTNNARLVIDGFAGPNPTFIPDNYTWFSGVDLTGGGLLPGATPGLPPNTFIAAPATNQSTAYEAILSAATQTGSDSAGQDITNVSGRIEINASKVLNLKQSRITALNTLMLSASNHYAGNAGARVSAPYYDLHLRTTNGTMAITNLVPETLPHPQGTCELWSGRWTNVVGSITNSYHVLVIESRLSPISKPIVQTLALRSFPDLKISDQLNVTRTFYLTAQNITLTTNSAGAASSVGSINFMSPDIVWPSSTPRLQNLTNWGFISTFNAVFFGGSRGSPFYNTTFNEPYVSFVNHGGITNNGSLIWSRYFENTGTFNSGVGAVTLRAARDAILNGGLFLAVSNDISIHAGNLTVTNHPLIAGGSLDLWVTNSIIGGGGVTNANIFTAGNGFNLFLKPETGDLLGTTVTNFSPPYAETLNFWSGEDRGANNSGFTDNVAIGRLILNGYTNAAFHFIATGGKNAIYVDSLELQGTAAEIGYDGTGYVIPALDIDDNMTIYFAQATIGGLSVAEHINGANHGRLVWVSSYAGIFSSETLTYTDSLGSNHVYSVNSALRNSTFIDSDGDGIVNAVDPTPFGDPPAVLLTSSYSAPLVGLQVTITNSPKPTALISWNTVHNSTNHVYYKAAYSPTNKWLTLTNFVYKGPAGRVIVKDPIKSAAPRFYKVRIDPPKKK